MATTEKTDLSVVEEKVALTDSTVKSTATAATGTKRGTVTKIVCKSAASWVLLGLLSIIPILQLIIGRRYSDQCPLNWRIPHYLYIAGVVGLVVAIMSIIQSFLVVRSKPQTSNLMTMCGLCGISIAVPVLLLFLFAWLIAGCVWILGAKSRVQYSDESQAVYCHPTLYRSALGLLLLSILFLILSCCCSCYQTITQLGIKKHCPTECVPRSEA